MHTFRMLSFAAAAATMIGTASAEPITIQVATAPSIYQQAYETIAAEFQKKEPDVRIDLLPAKREDEELIQATLRSAIAGQLPDVLFVSANLMRPLIDRQMAIPLDQIGITDEGLARLSVVPGTADLGRIGGQLYGLPLGVSTPIIAYNADLVRRAGGNPDQFPTTWAETTRLVAAVGKLSADTVGGFFEYDNTGNWTYKALVATLGGQMMSPDDRTITFDDAIGLEAFRILKAFGEGGQARIDMTRDQARQAFAAGKIGLIVTSSGALAGLERLTGKSFDLRAAPLPLAGPQGRVPAAGAVMMVLTKDSAKQKAALKFLQFAVSADAQTIMGTQTGLLSVNKEALEDPKRLANMTVERPNARAALDQLSRLTAWYAFPGDNSLKITAVIKEYLQTVLTLKSEPQIALAAMRKDVQALLPN